MLANGCTDFDDGMEEVVRMQREVDELWRENTLAEIRRRLQDECGVR
jgi:hypothetical protein